MDYLAKQDLINPESRLKLLGNRLALIAPDHSQTATTIVPGLPPAALLGDGRLAIAGVSLAAAVLSAF